MNGRIYDPLLGRFLSADVVVDGPNNLQGYNRYSYVKNNPLTAVDPSGFFGEYFASWAVDGYIYFSGAREQYNDTLSYVAPNQGLSEQYQMASPTWNQIRDPVKLAPLNSALSFGNGATNEWIDHVSSPFLLGDIALNYVDPTALANFAAGGGLYNGVRDYLHSPYIFSYEFYDLNAAESSLFEMGLNPRWEPAYNLGSASVDVPLTAVEFAVGGMSAGFSTWETSMATQSSRVAANKQGWLQHWEGVGRGRSVGHTIKHGHVGATDADLLSRLSSSPRLRSASTFTDQATAESVISQTISSNRNQLNAWVRSASPGDRLRLNYTGSDVIGRGVSRGASVGDRTNARIILQMRDNGKYHILTAFPE